MPSLRLIATLVAALSATALAKTDIDGCVSSETVAFGGASMIWYVPESGEICEFLDCGGGRAPPKTTVPGCHAYVGTATYSPQYLPGYGPNATPTPSSKPKDEESAEGGMFAQTTLPAGVTITDAPTVPSSLLTAVWGWSNMTVSRTEGGKNGTATSTGVPVEATGAAAGVGVVGQAVLGLAGMVAGLAML